MPSSGPDPRLVAYAQDLFRRGFSSESVSGRLAARYPGLSAADVDLITGRAMRLVQQSAEAGNAPGGTTLGQAFPESSTGGGNVQVDALVAFVRAGSSPAYRTLRFIVPWTITIEDYEAGIIALAVAWSQGGGPNNPTLGGGTKPDVIDPFHRVIPSGP